MLSVKLEMLLLTSSHFCMMSSTGISSNHSKVPQHFEYPRFAA